MKTYRAMYRCRLCGKAFYYGEAVDARTAAAYMIGCIVTGEDPQLHLLEPHDCGRPFESMGLADFIGWDVEEVKA